MNFQQSDTDEASAQVLHRIPADIASGRPIFRHEQSSQVPLQLNPPPTTPLPLQAYQNEKVELYVDIPLQERGSLFWFVLLSAYAVCLIVSLIAVNSIELYRSGGLRSVGCLNPTSFDNNRALSCEDFDLTNSPTLGTVVSDVSNWNEFIMFNLLVPLVNPSPTLQLKASLSVYSLSKGPLSLFGYSFYKQGTIVENIPIDYTAERTSLFHSDFTGDIKGFIIPLTLIRQIEAPHYLVTITLKNASQNLQTSIGLKLNAEYISNSYIAAVGAVRLFSLVAMAVATVVYWCSIRKEVVCFEQSLILWVGIVLTVSMDPLFLVTLIFPNIFSDILSSLMMTVQFGILLVFWNVVYTKWDLTVETTKRKMFIHAAVVFLMLGGNFFATTFTEFSLLEFHDPSTFEIVYMVLKILTILSFAKVIYQTNSLLWSMGTFTRRRTGFLLVSTVMMLLMLASVLLLDYRVYASEGVVGFVIPPFVMIYFVGLQRMFSPVGTGFSEESPETLPPVDACKQDNVEEGTEKMDMFDIEATEQFQKNENDASGL